MATMVLVAALALLGSATAANAKDTQFWNLTAHTITALQLSPAGKGDWGPTRPPTIPTTASTTTSASRSPASRAASMT